MVAELFAEMDGVNEGTPLDTSDCTNELEFAGIDGIDDGTGGP